MPDQKRRNLSRGVDIRWAGAIRCSVIALGLAIGPLSAADPANPLRDVAETLSDVVVKVGQASVGAQSFLNRSYHMLKIPAELKARPRVIFNGGEGNRIRLRFLQDAVVFAVFEYNQTGLWHFADRLPPGEHGWHLWRKKA